jgi:hypothetical protein
MVSVIVAGVLACSLLGFVLYPLYRARAERVRVESNGHVERVEMEAIVEGDEAGEERARDARTALREIELDYQLGNISEDDYRTLRERYVRRALVALKSRYEREQELDEVIEERLRDLKERHENADS